MLHEDDHNSGMGAPRKGDDDALVEYLALGWTHRQVAAELRLSTRTVSRRCRETAIAQRVRRRRAELLGQVSGEVAAIASTATEVLLAQLGAADPRVQLAAAKAVLDRLPTLIHAAARSEVASELEATELHEIPVSPTSWPGWDPEWPSRRHEISPWIAAERAVAESRWSWRDILDLLHPDRIEGQREELRHRAREVRAAREAGEPLPVEDANDAAAEIASYGVDEPLPTLPDGPLWHRIDAEMQVLHGAKPRTPAFGIGVHAAALKLVLGTPQAFELRREIWGEPQPDPHPSPNGDDV